MQSQPSTPLENNDDLFIESRNVYGTGTVVLTASISDGVVFLEQHPEHLTISRELHIQCACFWFYSSRRS
jgi:hypothetical protein